MMRRIVKTIAIGLAATGLAACSTIKTHQVHTVPTTTHRPASQPIKPPVTTASINVQLPVTKCPTASGSGLLTSPVSPVTPTVTISVPSSDQQITSSLSVFVDMANRLQVVAPRTWKCDVVVDYADGSAVLSVVPSGTISLNSLGFPESGIVASETSASTLSTLSQACPFFPAAQSDMQKDYPSIPCNSEPSGLNIKRSTSFKVGFSAPAFTPVQLAETGTTGGSGSALTQGVMLWNYSSSRNGAYTEVCAGDSGLQPVFTISLNNFASRVEAYIP